MGQGNYDHPSYLTRQQIALSNVAATASGTSAQRAFLSGMRLRNAVGAVVTAGTIGTNVGSIIQANGTGILVYGSTAVTTSTGVVALGTISYGTAGNTIGAIASSGDMNAFVPANSVVTIKNGLDATAVTAVTLEAYLDPSTTWTGVNN